MLGLKRKSDTCYHYFFMDELIPDDHILKLIDKHVDFSFIRKKTKHLYSNTGRPSIDPEILVRMLLIGYLNGITSERKLCEEIRLNVAYRWFLYLGMADKIPDHSTISKNRHGRFRESGVFQDVFDEIVRQCKEMGLVNGEQVTVDGSLVHADASKKSMEPVVVNISPEEYIKQIDKENNNSEKNVKKKA